MGKGKRVEWTQDEIQFLIDNYETTETKKIAEHIGKTVPNIHTKIRALGICKPNKAVWTKEEIEKLIELYPTMPNDELEKYFELHSGASIQNKAKKIGLNKTYNIERFWTDDDVKKLIELYPITPNDELEPIFNRTREQVRSKARKLGLVKTRYKRFKEQNEQRKQIENVLNPIEQMTVGEGMRKCIRCDGIFPLDEHHFGKKHGKFRHVCSVCIKIKHKKRSIKEFKETKICTKCKEEKPLHEFAKQRDKYAYQCKQCMSARLEHKKIK